MAKTKIEWAEHTWSPVTGCTPVSPGCDHCYARRMARRLAGRCGYPAYPNHFDVTLHPDRLDIPLKRKKPTTYFVCSMSDLFHEDVNYDVILSIWQVMATAKQHIFLVLTKRPERMCKVANLIYGDIRPHWNNAFQFPLPNVWLGVSVENQVTADERIPILLQTPAAIRFVSCEPCLSAIKLRKWLWPTWSTGTDSLELHDLLPPLDWVIVGGESGPGARPMHPDWARSLRDQCQATNTPYFFKQWGAYLGVDYSGGMVGDRPTWTRADGPLGNVGKRPGVNFGDGHGAVLLGKHRTGRMLDGREHNNLPNSPRI